MLRPQVLVQKLLFFIFSCCFCFCFFKSELVPAKCSGTDFKPTDKGEVLATSSGWLVGWFWFWFLLVWSDQVFEALIKLEPIESVGKWINHFVQLKT
jgi:hypothetical protein